MLTPIVNETRRHGGARVPSRPSQAQPTATAQVRPLNGPIMGHARVCTDGVFGQSRPLDRRAL
jgi:hypothetical protein